MGTLAGSWMADTRRELTRLERGRRNGREAAAEPRPAAAPWLRRLLGVPLAWKLVGKNVLVGTLAAFAVMAFHDGGTDEGGLVAGVLAAVAVSLAMSFVIVRVALRPLAAIEATAARVWRGDFTARAPLSLLADRDMARLGHTLNLLLDAIERDRERLRSLTKLVIAAQDQERARLARELHDSVAQTMAALVMQLGAAQREAEGPAMQARLALVRGIAGDALEEVRLLSHTVHPRVLEDLGLPAALEWLARQTQDAEAVRVTVAVELEPEGLTAEQASTLYRVAQEALRNAVRHGRPRQVRLDLDEADGEASLTVTDDGVGFDLAAAEERRPGMGLFSMRERVALVDGTLEIASTKGTGTRVRATIPLTPARDP